MSCYRKVNGAWVRDIETEREVAAIIAISHDDTDLYYATESRPVAG